jgi:hypothetical protein
VASKKEKKSQFGGTGSNQQDLNFELLKMVRGRNESKMILKLLAAATRIIIVCSN